MATLAQLRARVTNKVGVIDDATILDDWINEGATDFLLQTKCKVESGTTTIAAGENDFTLDTDILLVIDVYQIGSSQNYPMTQVTVPELLRMRETTSVSSTGPFYYAVAGANLLMVHPEPTATTTLTVYYVPRPVTLTTAGQSPDEIPVEFHKAIELFALAEAADADDDSTSAQGQRYREEYERWVMKARKYLNRKGNVRLPKIQVGPTWAGRTSRSQDVGPW